MNEPKTQKTRRSKKKREDFDSPWKEVIESYFQEFLAFLFPMAHTLIDWDKDFVFLDQEFRSVTRNAQFSRRSVDKLVRVSLKNGDELWIYLHVEIQAGHDSHFPKRMYVYNYRIFDKFDRPVGSFAVLADDSPTWCPNSYSYEVADSSLKFQFSVVKLKDYENRLDELLDSDNPVALVVAAHLQTRATHGQDVRRYQVKKNLIRLLARKGWPSGQIIHLLGVLDWLLSLPPELNQSLWQELAEDEEEPAMNYVSSLERIGIEKGMEQGLKQGVLVGEASMLTTLLQHRFGDELPEDIRKNLNLADESQLKAWMLRALNANSLDEVFSVSLH